MSSCPRYWQATQTWTELRAMASFRPAECCYRCLLPKKVCQPNSDGWRCFAREVIGVFLTVTLDKYELVTQSLPEKDRHWLKEIRDEEGLRKMVRTALEVETDSLGVQTARIVLLFIAFCSRFKDASEAKQ